MSTSTRHLIHDYGTIIDLQRHTVQFCTDMRSFIRYQITHLSSLQKVERLFCYLNVVITLLSSQKATQVSFAVPEKGQIPSQKYCPLKMIAVPFKLKRCSGQSLFQ